MVSWDAPLVARSGGQEVDVALEPTPLACRPVGHPLAGGETSGGNAAERGSVGTDAGIEEHPQRGRGGWGRGEVDDQGASVDVGIAAHEQEAELAGGGPV